MSAGAGTEAGAQTAQNTARLLIVLQLLRDAGADDLAEQCSTEAAHVLYHDLVHAVGRAAAHWRADHVRQHHQTHGQGRSHHLARAR